MANETWPNFFIVGAQRSGTTSLYDYLRQMEGIYMPPIKEPCFFSPSIPSTPYRRFVRDKNEYLDLFRGLRTEKAIGDASPFYLWDPKSPTLIYNSVPNARIIAIVRDPVERAFSSYLMNLNAGFETLPFFDAMLRNYNDLKRGRLRYPFYLELGFYGEQIERYLNRFGSGRVKIILFDEFIKNTNEVVREVARFLDVEPKPGYNVENLKINKFNSASTIPRNRLTSHIIKLVLGTYHTWRPRAYLSLPPSIKRIIAEFLYKKESKPQIPEKARVFLERLYLEDVVKLQKLLPRNIPWVK